MTSIITRFTLPHGSQLCLTQGDITEFRGCAIVNAADTKCLYGKGVDGAINKAGGPALIEARKKLAVVQGKDVRCPVGEAVATIGGNLTVSWVIHAVGPNFNPKAQWVQKVAPDGEALLFSAYTNAMRRAQEKGCKRVAFSLLSAGFFRGPKPLTDVLAIAVRAIRHGAYPGLEEAHLVSLNGGELRPLKQACSSIGLAPSAGGSGGSAGSSGSGGISNHRGGGSTVGGPAGGSSRDAAAGGSRSGGTSHGGSGSGDLRSFFSSGGGGSSSSAKRTAAVATVAGVSGEAPIELGSDGDTEEDEPSTKKARTRGPMGETLVID